MNIDATIAAVKKSIRMLENEELVEKYRDEIKEPIPEKGKVLFLNIYSRCRKSGNDQEYSMKVAKSVVAREVTDRSETKILKSIETILNDMAGEK